MNKPFVCAVLAALFIPVLLVAQTRFTTRNGQETWAERRTRALAERLTLTEAQSKSALALFAAADKTCEPLDEKLAHARRALRQATKKNTAEMEIDQLAAAVGVLTGQIAAIQAKADAAFYILLTAPQREKLDHWSGPPLRPRGSLR